MRQDNPEQSGKGQWRLRSARFETQQALLAGIRRGEEAAMRELFVIYVPVLREEARRLNVAEGHREQLVYTVLDDVALRLAETPLPPAAITTYVVNALRNRVRTEHRETLRERASQEQSYAVPGGSPEIVIAGCHSEYGIRISNGLESSAPAAAISAIERLARAITAELSSEDLALIVGTNRYIPLRTLAEEMKISYGAARVRLSRIRQRLAKVAVDYLDSLESPDRGQVMRFLRRANVRSVRPNPASAAKDANGGIGERT